jgi:phosphoglycerol transferase MdoB-like AlkP superfamily enzyme
MVTNEERSRRFNVVVVLEESLGSEFIGALHGGPSSLTPEYDALTAQGTLLTNAYSTGNRTIRAIEATTSSLPPLPGISIVRRPQSENLFTLPAVLREQGYDTSFIYGGRALFDGMGGYLSRNGVDRIVDQNDFPSDAFRTAWGVADEAIFDRALEEMDAQHALGRPFYALVLTVSNHRPFTFPEDHVVPDPELGGRQNAVRYADFALGRFMREARQHDFFDDTLFVLMGDHGARVYGAADIPLPSYQVPILLIAPDLVPAGATLDTLASTMDIPPTVLGLLGSSYPSKFFGNDLFEIPADGGRALMTHNNDIALMRQGRLAVLGLHRSTRLFERDQEGSTQTLIPHPDRDGLELIEDAIAFYQGANELYEGGGYQVPEGFAPVPAGTADAAQLPRAETARRDVPQATEATEVPGA